MEPPSPVSAVGKSLTPRVIPYPIPAHRIDPDAAKVVRRLVRYGHTAYLVGGCVRDLLLGRTPKDFDIATSARPSEVKSLFRNCRVIGRRFRLAHILFGAGKILEVATFRRDPTLGPEGADDWEDNGPEAVEAEGGEPAAGVRLRSDRDRGDRAERGERVDRSERHEHHGHGHGHGRHGHTRREGEDLLIRHDNVFGEPPEDAARRDFTMNALFYDLERQEIVDYVGGMAEIERRVIRTIGEPDVRFREDPIRILRAIKFAARLDLAIEPDVYDAMVAHRDDLLRAARPRLLEELLRLLRGGASRRSIWLAWETGALAVLVPELSSYLDDDPDGRSRIWRRLRAIDAMVADGEVPSDAVLLAALLLEPIEEAIDGERDVTTAVSDFLTDVVIRLAIPRRLIDRLRQILSVQRRLRTGRVGAINRRDYYPEAALLYALDATARGVPRAEIEAIRAGQEPGSRSRRGSQAPPRAAAAATTNDRPEPPGDLDAKTFI